MFYVCFKAVVLAMHDSQYLQQNKKVKSNKGDKLKEKLHLYLQLML